MDAFLRIIALGFLGIDPFSAIIVSSAIATRTKKNRILAFAGIVTIGPVVMGVTLSFLGQGAIDFIKSMLPSSRSPVWAMANFVVILAIICWLTRRFLKRNEPKEKDRPKKSLLGSTWHFIIAAILFMLTIFADPAYYGVIVIAAESHNLLIMLCLHVVWVIISQILLIAIVVAYCFNAHVTLLRYSETLWKAHKDNASIVLYSIAILIAVLLLADAIFYIASGAYLF